MLKFPPDQLSTAIHIILAIAPQSRHEDQLHIVTLTLLVDSLILLLLQAGLHSVLRTVAAMARKSTPAAALTAVRPILVTMQKYPTRLISTATMTTRKYRHFSVFPFHDSHHSHTQD